MIPGEVHIADIDEFGRRPVIVVSREELNRGRYVVVVPLTSSQVDRRRLRRNCVPFRTGQYGFTADCVAQCEFVSVLEKNRVDLARGPLGVLDEAKLRDVIRAIGFVIGSNCEPKQPNQDAEDMDVLIRLVHGTFDARKPDSRIGRTRTGCSPKGFASIFPTI